MRDIKQYVKNYNDMSFEKYQVNFRRKKVLEIIKKYYPTRILEIGCGMNPLFQYIDWPIENYTVVDPSEDFIKNAKRLTDRKVIHFINDEYKATQELKENSFDFIVCSGLLHEVEDPIRLVQEIVSICTQNTIVHINVPNANSMHRLIALEIGIIKNVHDMSERNIDLQQQNVFDLSALCDLTVKAGLTILDRGSYFIKPFTHQQMHQMMQQKIITEDVLYGLYELTKYIPELGSEIYIDCKL